MTLKSPSTYGEWYWKHSVDAQNAFDENIEDVFAPYFARLLAEIPTIGELPPSMQAIISILTKPPTPGFGGFTLGVGVQTVDELLHSAMAPAMAMMSRAINRRAKETWLKSDEAITLAQRKILTEDYFYTITQSEGYEDIIADTLYDSRMPYPSIPEIMLWARYHGDPYGTRSTVSKKHDVSDRDYDMWEWLGLQRLTTVQVQSLYKRGLLTDESFYTELGRLGWARDAHYQIKDLAYMIPNAMLQVQGDLFQGLTDAVIEEDVKIADIHPAYAKKYIDAVLTKPASGDIVAYQLRKDPELSGLPKELRRIGIHPEYHTLYRELAYQIPPVADIITMAVREAFSPDIAAAFGQYEDFPSELAEWAGKKGLSKEWAERYWAAHWGLPSPLQGFQMLHRGVITEPELHLLLRAQDVMPFWRDKLTQIAYRPLTRVDVRRMYKEGVLDEKEVYESYLDQGYAAENAERMAEFTVKQTLSSLAKFTSSDIIKAFSSRMIDSGEAMSLLRDIGIRSEDASYIISTAEYKRIWAFTNDQIAGIRNLYKKRIYDENQSRDKLARLNLPSDQINVLMEQWYFEKVEELDATWTTAQTIKFLKRKLITPERAERELTLIGYDAEHIDVYMRDLQWTQPKE